MAEKSLAQKMFLKPGKSLAVVNPPKDLAELIQAITADMNVVKHKSALLDVVLLFVSNRAGLESSLPKEKGRLAPDGALWVAYPKGTSKLKSDINRDSIREYAATIGLDTVSLVAIDADWSCLRLKKI